MRKEGLFPTQKGQLKPGYKVSCPSKIVSEYPPHYMQFMSNKSCPVNSIQDHNLLGPSQMATCVGWKHDITLAVITN